MTDQPFQSVHRTIRRNSKGTEWYNRVDQTLQHQTICWARHGTYCVVNYKKNCQKQDAMIYSRSWTGQFQITSHWKVIIKQIFTSNFSKQILQTMLSDLQFDLKKKKTKFE